MPYSPHTLPVANAKRLSAHRMGYGRQHEKWRKVILSRDPICVMCKKARATQADHIMPITRGGSQWSYDNGQGLCHQCHSRKTHDEMQVVPKLNEVKKS